MDIKIKSIHFDTKVEKPATADNKTVSLSVVVPGNTLFVEKTSDTFEESTDLCVDSMRNQLQKFKEKLRDR